MSPFCFCLSFSTSSFLPTETLYSITTPRSGPFSHRTTLLAHVSIKHASPILAREQTLAPPCLLLFASCLLLCRSVFGHADFCRADRLLRATHCSTHRSFVRSIVIFLKCKLASLSSSRQSCILISTRLSMNQNVSGVVTLHAQIMLLPLTLFSAGCFSFAFLDMPLNPAS